MEQATLPHFTRTEQTSFGCPSQWDAWDAQGNQYYLRFRWGVGTISLRARMVDGTDGHGQPGGREILVWRHTDVAIDYMHRAQIGGA